MELIRTRLQRLDDRSACDVAELGRGVAGFDLEFRNGVHVWLVPDAVVNRLIDGNAVQQKRVALLAVSVHIGAALRAHPSVREAARIWRDRARSQQRQLLEVAAVERQAVNRIAADHLSDSDVLRLQYRRYALNIDNLADAAYLQLQVDSRRLVDFELDLVRDKLLEARRFYGQHVNADR